MYRKLSTMFGVLGFGTLGFLLMAGSAAAEQGWPLNPPASGAPAAARTTYTRRYGSFNYTPSYPFGSPAFSAPPYSYESFSPGQTAGYYGSAAEERAAVIDVRLPADAVILFSGQKTTSTGPERRFISPSLTLGKEYVYEISVRWHQGGREVTHTRSLPVHAGERLNLAFGMDAPQ